jgi:hypothetical protein
VSLDCECHPLWVSGQVLSSTGEPSRCDQQALWGNPAYDSSSPEHSAAEVAPAAVVVVLAVQAVQAAFEVPLAQKPTVHWSQLGPPKPGLHTAA